MTNLFFFHGLESGPEGSKTAGLRGRFGPVNAPDFRGMSNLDARLQKADETTRGMQDLLLVGSSFGGLVAVLLAQRFPERVRGMVLCAPALHTRAAETATLIHPTIIVHGALDDVVPFKASYEFQKHNGGILVPVVDGHRLINSLDVILDSVQLLKSMTKISG